MSSGRKSVYTILAGTPFAKALAAQLLAETHEYPETLPDTRIILPTRRACRTLRESFLQLTNGRPLLLPRMQTLGDIDEEELSLNMTGTGALQNLIDLPPAISPMRRQILLARTIYNLPHFEQGFDHAITLARALGHLMDQIYTEGLDMKDLHSLVPDNFADHWQITIEFLKILSEHWPRILAENGVIDIADRRDRLIRTLAQYWQDHPPPFPVIAAGSTGSIPATALLIKTVAHLPQGRIVLPGLDSDIDQDSWDALDETHPQYGFKHLLDDLNMDRQDVETWPCDDLQLSKSRRILACEMMRPAATSSVWTDLRTSQKTIESFENAFKNLNLLECENEREEAETIALLMRETLETPERTATLITPDRDLAKRVVLACQRWNIQLDDSAGQSLDQTSLGQFLILIFEACLTQLAPVPLLALLKHPLCQLGLDHKTRLSAIQNLEKTALRGLKPAPGFDGIFARLETCEDNTDKATHLLKTLQPFLKNLIAVLDNPPKFKDLNKIHLQVAENLSGPSTENLWQGEIGEAAAGFFSELLDESHLMPAVSAQIYLDILKTMMHNITIRPAYGTHPRLHILGQLEARLIDADVMILSGLNEGTWPPDAGHDPWMSRPMRKDFGLPSPERGIGLSAHDFVQVFCAPHVMLTRAKRSGDAPSTPARWLQRLDTVLDAAGLSKRSIENAPAKLWAAQLDQAEISEPASRPAPTPPIDKRPKGLFATRVETWLQDPYSIYARYILRLRKLDPLDQPIDAAIRGSLLHRILERFISTYKTELPADAEAIFMAIAKEEIDTHHDDPELWSFWFPRLQRICTWFINNETNRRVSIISLTTESKGSVQVQTGSGDFTLSAIVDRMDRTDSGIAIIDYKSGGSFSKKALISGELPQLPLESLILSQGGFSDYGPRGSASLSYWKLTGGAKPGEIIEVTDNIDQIVTHTEENLKTLIDIFAREDTPYYSLPRPDKAPRFNDYEHLARVQEWTVLNPSDASDIGEAA